MPGSSLKPAAELARANTARVPNESAEYRRAREQLLAEEIELRRHAERVAELRRALPPGGVVTGNYEFVGESGKATLPDLFGNKQTLVIYSYMFGPQREKPCPMCTSFMGTWEAKLPDLERCIAFVFVARSPIARSRPKRRAAGRGTRSIRMGRATTRAITSPRMMPMRPATTFSRAATAPSAISGRAKWDLQPPTPVRIRVVRPNSIRCGLSSTPRLRAAARIGIRVSVIEGRVTAMEPPQEYGVICP